MNKALAVLFLVAFIPGLAGATIFNEVTLNAYEFMPGMDPVESWAEIDGGHASVWLYNPPKFNNTLTISDFFVELIPDSNFPRSMNGLREMKFSIAVNTTELERIEDYENRTYNVTWNCGSNLTPVNCSEERTRRVNVGFHFENWTREILVPVSPDYEILPGEKHKVHIYQPWDIMLGERRIDWVPGVDLRGKDQGILKRSDWAWWNLSFEERREIVNSSVLNDSVSYVVNDNLSVSGSFIWTRWEANCTGIQKLYNDTDNLITYAVADDAPAPRQCFWENASTPRLGGNNASGVHGVQAMGVWHFEDGLDINDSSQYARDGTLNGNPTSTTGKIGAGIDFDGDDALGLGTTSNFNMEYGAVTINAWVLPDAAAGIRQIFDNNNNAAHVSTLRLTGADKLEFLTRVQLPNDENIVSTNSVSETGWSMVTGVYDGSNIHVYINGVSDATPVAQTGVLAANTVNVKRVGCNASPCNAQFFAGNIDEVMVWNRSLDADEILQLYWNGIGNLTSLSGVETPDSNPPNLTVTSPTNDTFLVDSVDLNFTVSDVNPDSNVYSLDGAVNVTLVGNTTLTSLSDGAHNVIVFANDTFGNTNSVQVFFTVNAVLNITINQPGNVSFATVIRSLNVSNDTFSDAWIYEYDSNGTNFTFDFPSTLFFASGGDGGHTIRIWANDSVGAWSTAIRYFTLDTTPPNITIASPLNTSYLVLSVDLNVSADEATSTWIYSLNGGSNNTFTPNTSLTAAFGANDIVVWANDSVGLWGRAEAYFTADNVTVVSLAPVNSTTQRASTIEFIFRPNSSHYSWANASFYLDGSRVAGNSSALNNAANNTINYTFPSSGNFTWYIEACIVAGCVTSLVWDIEVTEGNVNIEVYIEKTEVLANGSTLVRLLDDVNYEELYKANATNGTLTLQVLARRYILRSGGAETPDYPYHREKFITVAFDADGNYTARSYQPASTDSVVEMSFVKNDYTGCYGMNTTLRVEKTINLTLQMIHERVFDSSNTVVAYLIANEDYDLRVFNPVACAGERVLGFYNAPTISDTQYLDIAPVTLEPTDLISSVGTDVFMRVWWANASGGDFVRLEYNDTVGLTTNVSFRIYNGSNLSQLVYSTTSTSSYVLASWTVSNMNYSYMGVIEAWHSTYGLLEFGPTVFKPDLKRVSLGGSTFIPSWLYRGIAWVVLMFVGVLFGPKNAGAGGLVFVGFTSLFYYFGWLEFRSSIDAGVTIGLIAMLAIINVLTKPRVVVA